MISYCNPRKIRRLLLQKARIHPFHLILILIILCITLSLYFPTQTELPNTNCMPITIDVANYDTLIKHADKTKHPECAQKDWVIVNPDATITYNHLYLKANQIEITSCQYKVISWGGNDFKFKKSDPVDISEGQALDLNSEFFSIQCKSTKKGVNYEGLHARIFKKKNKSPAPKRKPINIMFLGLDSVSREKWLTNLPRSSHYFLKTMKANVLNGYNIVGDGTPAAIIPILTSKHEEELPNVLKGSKIASHVDEVYPFIWKDFVQTLNYATLYNEDWPQVGVFEYRMIGFKHPPTTHYLRPFQLAKSTSKICEYGRSSIKVNLDYLEDFMRLYKDTGFFSFSHIKQYTHNEGLNDITWLDDAFLEFFTKFNEDQSLSESTILFTFSDHGPRYSKLRKSIKGLLHERNPFFSIYIPKLFEQRYPNECASLRRNLNRVLAPMDIYATLLNIINLESGTHSPKNRDIIYEKGRSTSVFSDISPDRNCDDAGINSYWCSCLKRTKLEITPYLNSLASDFTNYLNNEVLKEHLDLCAKLEIDSINSVYLVKSYLNTNVTKPDKILGIENKEIKKLHLLKPPSVEQDYMKYLFVVTTRPNGGEYEFTVTVQRNVKNNSEVKEIDRAQISRINKYGNDEHCIHEKYPDLRKYCYCL